MSYLRWYAFINHPPEHPEPHRYRHATQEMATVTSTKPRHSTIHQSHRLTSGEPPWDSEAIVDTDVDPDVDPWVSNIYLPPSP